MKSEIISSGNFICNYKSLLSNLLFNKSGEKVIAIKELSGGRNSLIFKMTTDTKQEYLAKKYLVRKDDNRDRLSTEFYGLSFLWDNGIKNIPQAICLSKKEQIGIYSFIKGKKIQSRKISMIDISKAAAFLGEMRSLVNVKNAKNQPIASEACFTVNDYIDSVERRLNDFKKITLNDGIFKLLYVYLDKEFIPFFYKIKQITIDKSNRLELDIKRKLQKSVKTLSPSDFGFHNVIKGSDGSLHFVDFEYYGWDDPAKLIADFYLQPAVPVPLLYREIFFQNISQYFENDKNLATRLSVVYPILGLKWCLIMLNVFFWFLEGKKHDETVCLQQLEKSKNKLREIKSELEKKYFPISTC